MLNLDAINALNPVRLSLNPMEASAVIALILTTLLINASPGPDMIYCLGQTISGGRFYGLAAAYGVCFGSLIHTVIAGTGLAAILSTSPLLYAAMKHLGAAYLIGLGIQSIRQTSSTRKISIKKTGTTSYSQSFARGVLTNVLNPKIALFFLAFLPQFMTEDGYSSSIQMMTLGGIFVLTSAFSMTVFVLLVDLIRNQFLTRKSLVMWVDRIFGMVLVGLGLRIFCHSD